MKNFKNKELDQILQIELSKICAQIMVVGKFLYIVFAVLKDLGKKLGLHRSVVIHMFFLILRQIYLKFNLARFRQKTFWSFITTIVCNVMLKIMQEKGNM